ncbi:MAG: peroxiredoxin [Myxococcaceae bacterium]
MLAVGDVAPDFETLDCRGRPFRLSALRGKQVVLFFFPKAFTVGCTQEVGHFRDNYDRIVSGGAELVGVSVDNSARQCAFAESEHLNFTLIGDEPRTISESYGVLWPILRIDRRVTFVISPEGIIEAVIKHEVRVGRHLDDVLQHLNKA